MPISAFWSATVCSRWRSTSAGTAGTSFLSTMLLTSSSFASSPARCSSSSSSFLRSTSFSSSRVSASPVSLANSSSSSGTTFCLTSWTVTSRRALQWRLPFALGAGSSSSTSSSSLSGGIPVQLGGQPRHRLPGRIAQLHQLASRVETGLSPDLAHHVHHQHVAGLGLTALDGLVLGHARRCLASRACSTCLVA